MTRLAALLAVLAAPALAQDAAAPCLQVLPHPADYVAAFEAEGWTLAEGPAREEALRSLALARYLVTRLPRPPETAEEAARLLAAPDAGETARVFAASLVLTRGEEVAAVDFNPGGVGDGHAMGCWIAAPRLPDLDALGLRAPPAPETPLLIAEATPPLPTGAESLRLHASRLASPHLPSGPIPGADLLVVELRREEPRFVLLGNHGPLVAFGRDELPDALREPAGAAP